MSELSGLNRDTDADNQMYRILVVEDERLVAVDIKHRLERLGYSVVRVVGDGLGAISATKELSPHLVLMDIGLQGAMDGIEAASEIGKLFDIPIIFVTANADDAVLQRALKGNVVGYVLKPFRDRELVVSIEMARYKAGVERELREARWWTDNTLETVSEGVVAADHSGLIRYMNSSAELLTGWGRDEARGKTTDSVLHTEPLADDAYDPLPSRGAGSEQANPAFFLRRARLNTKNGGSVPVELVERVLYSPEGRPCGLVYSLKDISEYLRYEGELHASRAEALEAARSRSEFVANMSHELRTPLNSIIGMSELALERAESVELREFLSILRNSGDSLLSLINGILDFSKIESGKMEFVEHDFQLLELFQGCLEHIAAQAHKKKVRVVQFVPVSLAGKVTTDKQKLKQVLLNLLSNAVKFTSSGEIVLSVVQEAPETAGASPMLCIEVKDSGEGIPAEKLDQVFDAFTQLDGSATRNYGGTGIGLSITRSLVDLFGGTVSVESEPGLGTTFCVRVPLVPAAYELTPRKVFVGRRVSLYSSSESEREFVRDWLYKAGLDVRQVEQPDQLKTLEEDGEGSDLVLGLGLRGRDLEFVSGLVAKNSSIPAFVSVPIAGPTKPKIVQKTGFVLNEPLRIELLLHRLEVALAGEAEEDGAGERPISQKRDTEIGEMGNVHGSISQGRPEHMLVVLLADDDNINRLVNSKLLEQLGHKVIKAENGRLAVERLRRTEVDLVLMDLEMPELDGFAAASAIRKGEAGDHVMNVPIVAVTAHTSDKDRQRVFAEGMNAMLVKPFAMDSLAKVIADVTGSSAIDEVEGTAREVKELDGHVEATHLDRARASHTRSVSEFVADLSALVEDVSVAGEALSLEEAGRRSTELRRSANALDLVEIDNLLFRAILACKRNDSQGLAGVWSELEGALDEVSRSRG